jgi:hypothetical protein
MPNKKWFTSYKSGVLELYIKVTNWLCVHCGVVDVNIKTEDGVNLDHVMLDTYQGSREI